MGMQFKVSLLAILFLLAVYIPNIHAATIDVGINATEWTVTDGTNIISPSFGSYFYEGPAYGGTESFSGWWQASRDFTVNNLDSSVAHYIDIDTFAADDRAALLINNQLIQMVGIIDGRTEGAFSWTKGGDSEVVPVTDFTENYISASTALRFDLSGKLQEGENTIDIIVNDTNNGITGLTLDLVTVGTHLKFGAEIDYAQIQNSQVPEPATMTLLGFGLLGMAGMGRKQKMI